jgi:hypothetical protein
MRPRPEEHRLLPSALFGFLAETLDDVARRIEVVEAHAAGIVAGQAQPDPKRVMVLQDLDLIRQMAQDAARIARAARRGDGARRADLAAELHLSALRDRLLDTGRRGAADPDGRASDGNGMVELFSLDGPGGAD